MVGILLSYWGSLFSGAMLVSGRVYNIYLHIHLQKIICFFQYIFLQPKKPSAPSLLGPSLANSALGSAPNRIHRTNGIFTDPWMVGFLYHETNMVNVHQYIPFGGLPIYIYINMVNVGKFYQSRSMGMKNQLMN